MTRALLTALLLLAACGGSDPEPTPDENVLPEAKLTAMPELAEIGQEVAFSAGGSLDTDGFIVSYRFVFADGSPQVEAAAPSATHRFAAPGLYQVTLTVTDDRGGAASATALVNVTDPP